MLLAAISLLLSLKSSPRLSSDVSVHPSSLAGCWDGCFDASSLAVIDEAGRRRSHSFTNVFDWRCEARSPLEYAIQSVLQELEDPTASSGFFVEYWWRDAEQIRPLKAHRDVDEALCRHVQLPVSLGSEDKIGVQQCPNFGHVHYVNVENVLAPTLVFEEKEATDDDKSRGGGPPRELKSLWSVPACSNRLLRFRGDCLHAVSYPPLEWLDVPANSKTAMETTEFQRRAVLLFNTWEKPPSFPAVGGPLVSGTEELVKMHSSRPKCRAMSSWTDTPYVPPVQSPEKDLVPFSVPLLGGFSRRGCVESSLLSMVSAKEAVTALTSKSTVQGVTLHAPVESFFGSATDGSVFGRD